MCSKRFELIADRIGRSKLKVAKEVLQVDIPLQKESIGLLEKWNFALGTTIDKDCEAHV